MAIDGRNPGRQDLLSFRLDRLKKICCSGVFNADLASRGARVKPQLESMQPAVSKQIPGQVKRFVVRTDRGTASKAEIATDLPVKMQREISVAVAARHAIPQEPSR